MNEQIAGLVERQTAAGESANSGPNVAGPLPLRVNFLWTMGGNFVYAACQWAMLVTLAKLGTPQMVGQFALALAITAPVMIGFGLDLRSVLATDARGQYPFRDYFMLRSLAMICAVVLVGCIVTAGGYGPYVAAVVVAVAFAKAFESISDIVYGLLQRNERMDRIALSMMIKGPLTLLALSVCIWLRRDLLSGVICMAMGWAGMMLFFDLPSARLCLGPAGHLPFKDIVRGGPRLNRLWRLSMLAAPVGFVMALASFNTGIPRYFIEKQFGSHDLGIFAAMAYPMVAGNTIVFALGQSASPRLAIYFAEGKCAAFWKLLLRLLSVGITIGAAGVVCIWGFGDTVLRLLYRPEYAGRGDVFLLLGSAAAVSYLGTLLGEAMCATRHFRAQLPVFCSVTVAMAMSCWVLIPRSGLAGAALATVIASAVQTIGSACVVIYAMKRRGASCE